MKLLIAIDGACRRNGKPDCVSSAGVFVQKYEEDVLVECEALSAYEYNSTNQRGELHALQLALEYASTLPVSEVAILTDSEYLFNAMTKCWYINWIRNNWLTRDNTPVKNKDIWLNILAAKEDCDNADIELVFYHIKGHCIPFGKVTASALLDKDDTGRLLHDRLVTRYDEVKATKELTLAKAQELSLKNNGYAFQPDILKRFVVSNAVVDAIATREVDAADLRS